MSYSRDEATEGLWRAGILQWKLRSHQLDLYDLIANTKALKTFIDCSRRFGKSHTLCLYAVECGLRNSKWLMRFAAPTMLDLEEIYHPIMEIITEDCPEDIKPVWRTTRGRGHYFFPSTGSKLFMFGTDKDNWKKGRGKLTHLGIFDEVAAADMAEHVVNSIMMPQTMDAKGRIFMATTPPESPGHESAVLKAQCQAAGNYFKRTIHDNTHLTPEMIAEYMAEAGGPLSTTFRREYLCEWVTDQQRAVIPEFTDEKADQLVREFEVPPYYHPTSGMDLGMVDFTFVVFGYYDFWRAVHCVQDEVMINRMTTPQLNDAIQQKEKELWGDRKVFSRVSDTNEHVLHDLSEEHNLTVQPTAKDHLEAQINQVRMLVASNRIEIHPRCQNLIRQMKTAIWNKARTTFDRTKQDGHFDGVAALIYWIRNAPTYANPYPAMDPSITPNTHYINREAFNRPPSNSAAAFGGLYRKRLAR